MSITIDWPTGVITVPRADMTLIQSTPIEVRDLNLDTFRLTLKDLEDDFAGMGFTKTHNHNTIVEISGIQLARVIEILEPYTITFEDGSYAVNLIGANSNVADRVNLNAVSVRASNSAGLVQTREIQYSSFQNTVFIDTINGTAGNAYPLGTASDPVDNLNDAKFIASLRGFDTISILGNLTLGPTDVVDNYILQGQGATFNNPKTTVTMSGGCSTSNTEFHACRIEGTQGGETTYKNCVIGTINETHCKFEDCGLIGPVQNYKTTGFDWITSSNHTTDLKNCYTSIAWYELDYNDSSLHQVYTNFSGKLKISNYSNIEAELIIQIDAGEVWLDSTCSGTAPVTILGVGTLTNNSTLVNVDIDGLMSKDTIASAVGDEIGSEIQYASYGGGITISPATGVSGTAFPIGTQAYPVNNIVDATTIASSVGFNKLFIKDDLTLGADAIVDDLFLIGESHVNTHLIIEPACSCVDTSIQRCLISGTLDGGTYIDDCIVSNITYVNGHIHNSELIGTVILDGNVNAVISDCTTIDQDNPPIIDMNSSGQSLAMPNYSGLITVSNLSSSDDEIGIGLNSGMVILDSSITAGTIVIAGIGILMDNSTAGTVNIDGLISKDTIAGAVWDQTQTLKHLVESTRGTHTAFGTVIYWDPYSGNDSSNGTNPDRAVKTFNTAKTLTTAGHTDVIFALANDPAGTTTVSGNIVIDIATLQVRGPGETFELYTSSGTGVSLVADGVGFEGFKVQSTGSHTHGEHCVVVSGSTNFKLKNLYLSTGRDDGIHIENCNRGLIDTVNISECSHYGLHFVDVDYCVVQGINNIRSCGVNYGAGSGIFIDGTSHGVHIHEGTEVHNCGGYGIYTASGTQETFVHPNTRLFSNTLGSYLSEGVKDSIGITIGTEPIEGLIYRVEGLRDRAPATGRIIYYDPILGNDINDGHRPDRAKGTFSGAHDIVTDGGHDIIQILDNNFSSTSLELDEQWVITKSDLSVRGPGWDLLLSPTTTSGNTITVTGEEVSLEKFQVRTSSSGSNQSCIIINNNNCNISEVKIKRGTHAGIMVNNADNLFMSGCLVEHFTTGSGYGVCIMGDSHENCFSNNFIYDCNYNIHVMGTSHENTLKTNVLHDAAIAGLKLDAGTSHTYIHSDNIIANNATDIIDNATGTYYHSREISTAQATETWDRLTSQHTTSGTMGYAQTTGTAASIDYDLVASAVWDEQLTGGTHNVPTSAGRRLRQLASSIILDGTAVSAGTNGNQIQLDTDASSIDGAYDPAGVSIITGTGAGQSRGILQYDGATRTATVDRGWKITPDDTSEYIIYGWVGREHVHEGLAVSGTLDTMILNSFASSEDDMYMGQTVFIRSGTGEDQSASINGYDGATRTITIEHPWKVIPDTTTGYVILAQHQHVVEHIGQATWDVLDSYPTISGSMGTKFNELTDNVQRALGLVQENYYIDNTAYTTYSGAQLMTSGRMRTYSTSASVGTDNNVIATYNIEAGWTNDQMDSYKVTKV